MTGPSAEEVVAHVDRARQAAEAAGRIAPDDGPEVAGAPDVGEGREPVVLGRPEAVVLPRWSRLVLFTDDYFEAQAVALRHAPAVIATLGDDHTNGTTWVVIALTGAPR